MVQAQQGEAAPLAQLVEQLTLNFAAANVALKMIPIEYVWYHRVVVGKKFLAFTELPIKDIASRCGFKTTQHFSRKFEESVGSNPTTFRTVAVSGRKKSF